MVKIKFFGGAKILPFVGGKNRQSKWMYNNIPKKIYSRYIEVFGGAMWMYVMTDIYKHTGLVIYNDLDPLMYNLFMVFSTPKLREELVQTIKDWPMLNEELFEMQKEVIKNDFESPSVTFAASHIYLVLHLFSGITGTLRNPKLRMIDKQYKFPTMTGSAIYKKLTNSLLCDKLDKIKPFNLSFDKLLPKVDIEEAFIYLDPPYYGTEKLYKEGGFNKDNHIWLADFLSKCKAKWMLSYYDFPLMQEWYPKDNYRWLEKEFVKPSVGGGKGSKKGKAIEVLVMNY